MSMGREYAPRFIPVPVIYLMPSCVLLLKWWETKLLFHFRLLMGTYQLMCAVMFCSYGTLLSSFRRMIFSAFL